MSPEKVSQARPLASLAYIHASGGLGHQLDRDQAPPSLRNIARQRFGPALRQASRFIELALLGVADCLQSMPSSASPAIPLYVASGLGEVQKTMTLFATVTGAVPEPAAPFDFINAANNTAAFYIAKHFTGCSRNFTICDGMFSFESALRLALLECRRAAANYVLVGGIDEAIASRAEYGRRYAGADPHTMAEGSYWFLLSAQAAGAIAEVLLAEIFANRPGDDADAWALDIARVLREHAPAHSPLQLLSGAGVDTQHTKALMQHFSGSLTSKNNSIKSYSYPTAAARDLSRWLRHTSAGEPAIRCAAHVSRDSLGRTAVTLLRKSPR